MMTRICSTSNSPIYLDHAATTPLHPEVLQHMLPYWQEYFGNPSSLHAHGRMARHAVDDSRDRIAERLDCRANELVFTSGGTESDNLALTGSVMAVTGDRKHIITSSIEHPAVLECCKHLESVGYELTYLPVNEDGRISVEHVKQAIRPHTVLISLMYGNNETGTIQPIEEVGQLAREAGIPFHVDAVQALGIEPLSLSSLPVDLMSFSAHKINGPKGIGLLYVASGHRFKPTLYGGSQQQGRRPGTEQVASIVGMAKAIEFAVLQQNDRKSRYELMKQKFWNTLMDRLAHHQVFLNGPIEKSLSHILNISFPGIESDSMLMNLDLAGISASAGSACSAGSLERSHVLDAMPIAEERKQSAIRFSFGAGNTVEQVVQAAGLVADIVTRLQK